MSTRSSAESSASPSITIEEAFAYCRAHPVEGIDLDRFLGIFVSDPRYIVDAREFGLLGIIMDRLMITDDAKPFEWVGAAASKIDAQIFPQVFARVRDTARSAGVAAVDITLSSHWSEVRDLLAEQGVRPQFVDLELTHADCNWGPDRPLPQGWRWVMASPDHEPAYLDLMNRAMGPMPGIYVPMGDEALASMRLTADGTKLLLDADGAARALVRCKLAKRYLHMIACAPEVQGRGLGRLALDEVRRMLGPGPLHLTVVKQNTNAHGFYLHMGFAQTDQVETWRIRIAA